LEEAIDLSRDRQILDLNALLWLPSTRFVAQIYHTFRPDGAIFRYIGVLQSPVSLSATLPTLASVYTLGVRCVYGLYMPCVVKCIAYWISTNVIF
jgi:hypothetical protein